MEKPARRLELLSMARLHELAEEYISKLDRDKVMLGHRYVVSTGDRMNKSDGDMGFLQFIQKTLDIE